MKRGDLVYYEDRHWVVHKYDPKRTRTAHLLAEDGRVIEIEHDLDTTGTVRVIANPPTEWPFLTLPEKSQNGKLCSILRGTVTLAKFTEWVPSDPIRSGGPVFFSPRLRLRIGEQLLVIYEHRRQRAVIPSFFGTVGQRSARAEAKPKVEERTFFTRLLADDEDD